MDYLETCWEFISYRSVTELLWFNLSGIRLESRLIKLESRLPGEISITSYMQMTPPLWQRVKMKKVGLKLNIQKTKIMASVPITSWEIGGETVETLSD